MKRRGTAQKHSRTRRNAYLIEPKYAGEFHRCSICKNPVRTLRYPTRAEGSRKREVAVAYYCDEDEVIFPFARIVLSKHESLIVEKRR